MAIRLDTKLNLKNNETYMESSLVVLKENVGRCKTVKEVEEKLNDINSYINIEKIETPKDIYTFDDNVISEDKLNRAKLCILNGGVFFEHAAAGEATRLKLGTKYILNIPMEMDIQTISQMMSEEGGKYISAEEVVKLSTCYPKELMPISLGTRHMAQLIFDLKRLAEEFHRDPKAVLSLQKVLIILNEKTAEQIINEFIEYNFFGLQPENVFFMVQRSFHGIGIKNGKFFYDESSPKRLHNHGQMVMQTTLDNEIFFMQGKKRKYLKSSEFGAILKQCDDKISYNIEDIGYLTGSLDFASLAVALNMKDRGFKMMMEIVANNPIKPQKGGMAAYDPLLKKNVMIESFQLKGIKNGDIKYLNKNFNHYPDPYFTWKRLKERGLPMPIAVKRDYIFFQPVQGDINFLVNTQFVMRKELKPIQNWKSPATTPPTIAAMKKQDEQPGFKEFLEKFLRIRK